MSVAAHEFRAFMVQHRAGRHGAIGAAMRAIPSAMRGAKPLTPKECELTFEWLFGSGFAARHLPEKRLGWVEYQPDRLGWVGSVHPGEAVIGVPTWCRPLP
jgi:hypothetical protein